MTILFDSLKRNAATQPEGVALDDTAGHTVTWAQLLSSVERIAAQLRSDHDPQRPVALRLDHSPETVVLELALLEAGVPVLSLPSFFTEGQSDHALSVCGARAIFAVSPREKAQDCRTAPSPLPYGTARITFTSGSTGSPKGVCLSSGHMLTVAQAVVDALGNEHAGRHLALLPPGILLETVAGLFATLLAGGTYVCPPQAEAGLANPFRPDFGKMLWLVASQSITSLILVPEYLTGLVTAMEETGLRLPKLTLVAVGGAHTSPELIARARALGLPVRQGYGLTECASVVSLEQADSDLPGSVGKPLAHLNVRISDDGEVVIDGPTCLGTVGGEPHPGPLHTGDLGRIDEQGRLWISGRKSNLIVTSFGRNVSPEWVEAVLLQQPGIAQAMVFGDGGPAPQALLVPSHPRADLAAAVAAANASLPAYAQLSAWREVAPFTPMNGMLTGNGRLRRDAIASTWLADGQPDFFTELEAATLRQRMAFLSIPQVQAGLTGQIGLQTYRDYLAQAWHHVRHTVPLMQAARARLLHRPELVAALDDYIEEEDGHDEWILSDIAAAGGDAEAIRRSEPAHATRAMVQHAYECIGNGNPVSFFGMVYVLESVSVALAQRGASAVAERLGLPPKAFTYLTSHGALDQDHMRFFAELVNGLADPADRETIVTMARDMFALFGEVFASISLETLDVAA
ncbi:MAG: AMP-binding protein [Novosphingobium sp.]|nr:AMP-binding protein [Novosphingobium sp.]